MEHTMNLPHAGVLLQHCSLPAFRDAVTALGTLPVT